MAKSVNPSERRPAPPPSTEAQRGNNEVVGAVLEADTGTINVSLQAVGKRSEWASNVDVDLNRLPPNVVTQLLTEALKARANKIASSKVTVNKGDDKVKVDMTEKLAATMLNEMVEAFYTGETGVKQAKGKKSALQKEMLAIAKERVRAFAKKEGLTIKAPAVTKQAENMIAAGSKFYAAIEVLAKKRLSEKAEAAASVDLKGLGLERLAEPSKPGTKKPKKNATAADLAAMEDEED